MIEQDLGVNITFILVMMLMLIVSIFIPFLGYVRKRWMGLALGCLLQIVVCILTCGLGAFCISVYANHHLRQQRKAAMVTVRKADVEGFSHNWYVKANDECLYEYKKDDDDDSDDDDNDKKYDRPRKIRKLFDVIPLDSFRVSIDDIVVIKFDLKGNMVTATEYDEPIEVVNIDWDKVHNYFEKQSSKGVSASEK